MNQLFNFDDIKTTVIDTPLFDLALNNESNDFSFDTEENLYDRFVKELLLNEKDVVKNQSKEIKHILLGTWWNNTIEKQKTNAVLLQYLMNNLNFNYEEITIRESQKNKPRKMMFNKKPNKMKIKYKVYKKTGINQYESITPKVVKIREKILKDTIDKLVKEKNNNYIGKPEETTQAIQLNVLCTENISNYDSLHDRDTNYLGTWSKMEDELLTLLIEKHGKKWSKVQEEIPNRTAKQCRERYVEHLNPNIIKGFWREEEDNFISTYVTYCGKTWSKLQTIMSHRSYNDIKNRWHVLQNKGEYKRIL